MFVAIWGQQRPPYLAEDLCKLQREGKGVRQGNSFLMDVNTSAEALDILGSLFDTSRGDILLMAGYAAYNEDDHFSSVANFLRNASTSNPRIL